MNISWNDDEDQDSNDDSENMSEWVEACDPQKQYQITITISSFGTSPIARVDYSRRAGALGLPAFLLKEDMSGSIDSIDVSAHATRLQLDFLLHDAELYKDHGLPPPDYTPGNEMAAAHVLAASLLDHIQSIADRLESE
jgi:hypothetical protein